MPYQGITYDHESFRAEGLGGTLATLESITWNYGKPCLLYTSPSPRDS